MRNHIFRVTSKIFKNMFMVLLIISMSVTVLYADTAEQIRDEAKEDLKDTEEQIEDINKLKDRLENDIESAAKEIDTVLGKQKDIADKLTAKHKEIDIASSNLSIAIANKDKSYEDMKLRIKYMYENSTDNTVFDIFLGSKNMADMLSRMEYFQSIYEADRKLLNEYKTKIVQVEELQVKLYAELNELMELQDEYMKRQANLQVYIERLAKESESYKTKLDTAKKQAKEYEKIIAEQERIIREQEAAAAKAEAEKYQGGGTGAAGLGSAAYLKDPSCDPAFTSNVTGEELVNYALQFVGNPYKWGGNSLTNGCDCSGFVKLIYQNFGFDTPRYSQSFKTFGKPVAYQNIKPGDVVVYPGHVAIYIGDGKIVEAQSVKRGITCNRSLDSHTILAIRRIL